MDMSDLDAIYGPSPLAKEKAVKVVKVPRGTVLFEQGDPGDAAYVVNAGAIAIIRETNGRAVPLATIRPEGLFGEMAVIDGSPRMASAKAVEDSTLLRISADAVADKMKDADPFLKILVNLLMANLRNVHEIYMPKPRTLNDVVGMLHSQVAMMSGLLEHKADKDMVEDLKKEIDAIGKRIEMIRKLAADFHDREPRADTVPRDVNAA